MSMIRPSAARARAEAPPPPLAARLQALFPSGVALALTDPREEQPALVAREAEAMRRAVPKRQREFAAGRAAARRALAQLGRAPCEIPQGPDRAPIWPEGIAGSISHIDTLCVAALARQGELRALGIDLEPAAPLDPVLLPEICTLAERAWLACQPEPQRGLLARLIFSAKECAYKCQYPLTGRLVGFGALEITPDLDTGQFEATFAEEVGSFAQGTCLAGRFVMTDEVIACAMTLARGPRWGLG
ncbi:4'-phosphopantetheinyl transferase family protein [Roseovarius aquimarinus]|uniref:Enterobactin synthase component D n=1 Tax=Roseovarius aquimarinus TaxID=1229156 RepID=A0ABW7I3V1_9RHOB